MKKIILAIPKGRILQDLIPLFNKISLKIEADFYNDNSRKLVFTTNFLFLEVVKVRSFDVATFVKFGGASLGICGLDVLKEFSSQEILPILDLNIGKCRLSIASQIDKINNHENDWHQKSHLRIATKYPNIANNYFANLGIQTEIIKLNGAIEIAPKLQLCDYILDLVSSGKTLQENNMIEIKKIFDVSSYLVVNRNSLKTNSQFINQIINIFDV
jgi:ATP phosphoribosyltransferase